MKNLIILALAAMLCSISCEKPPLVDYYYDIIVTNNSSAEIRVYLADEYASKQYPDTTLPDRKPALQKARIGKSCYFDSRTSWAENLKKLPRDTLSIFFIDNDVYETEPWDSVRIHYKVLNRLDLSIEDLKAKNCNITYP